MSKVTPGSQKSQKVQSRSQKVQSKSPKVQSRSPVSKILKIQCVQFVPNGSRREGEGVHPTCKGESTPESSPLLGLFRMHGHLGYAVGGFRPRPQWYASWVGGEGLPPQVRGSLPVASGWRLDRKLDSLAPLLAHFGFPRATSETLWNSFSAYWSFRFFMFRRKNLHVYIKIRLGADLGSILGGPKCSAHRQGRFAEHF